MLFEKTWTVVCTVGHDGRKELINREYGILDQAAIRKALCRACESPRVRVIKGKVNGMKRTSKVTVVEYVDCFGKDGHINSPIVVDASGSLSEAMMRKQKQTHKSSLKRRYQAFHGEFLRFPHGHQLPVNSAVLMDWSMNFQDELTLPSFAYVLPLSKDTVLVEETVLLSDVPLNLGYLKKRLDLRKQKLFGSSSNFSVVGSEKHNLPMGGKLLPPKAGVICFGGRNNMGNAATGYMFGFVVAKIPTLVKCIKQARGDPITNSDRIIRRLNDMGAYVLSTTKNRARLSQFMQASFRTPFWYEFMTRQISPLLYIANMCTFAFHLRKPQHLFWLFQHVGIYVVSACMNSFQGLSSFWPYTPGPKHQDTLTRCC